MQSLQPRRIAARIIAREQCATRARTPASSTVVSLAFILLTFAVWSMTGLASRASAFPDPPDLDVWRSIDGTGNNLDHPGWGAAGTPHQRIVDADYADGAGVPPGDGLPGARAISNAVATQWEPAPNTKLASNFLWQWGQFIDHDIALSRFAEPREPFDIPVPPGDPFFDPKGTGDVTIPLPRSEYVIVDGGRQQINSNTSFIDASMVYGSDAARATAVRTLDGTGRLATSAGDFLPFNLAGLPNEPTADDPHLLLGGDVRANEQTGLTAMHTLFLREHNHHAEWIGAEHPHLSGDAIYELARAIVAAEIQAITYREFLPMLLGPEALAPYAGYDGDRQANTANIFAGACYRVGHTLLSPTLLRLDAAGNEIEEGHLSLADAFFDPSHILATGVEPVLRGLAMAAAQDVDPMVIDDVRNFLFGAPGAGGMDLVSLNLQRGRDHGLPRYNAVRAALDLAPRLDFDQVSSNPDIVARLSSVYASVDDIDLWAGAVCEDHTGQAMVGELLMTVIGRQFAAFRDGDRFWYESYLPQPWIDYVESQTLATIIRRNTTIGNEISDDVFTVPATTAVASLDVVPSASRLALGYPYPNPAAGGTSVLMSISITDAAPHAAVFDVTGRQVTNIGLLQSSANEYQAHWDGRDQRGRRVAAGVYFLIVESGDARAERKLVVADR